MRDRRNERDGRATGIQGYGPGSFEPGLAIGPPRITELGDPPRG